MHIRTSETVQGWYNKLCAEISIALSSGNGLISRTLSEKYGVKCTLIDPNPRCYNKRYSKDDSRYLPPFDVIAEPLNGNGELLQSKGGPIRKTIRNCSLIIGLHPDQATEPIVELALSLRVPFAIIPWCVKIELIVLVVNSSDRV